MSQMSNKMKIVISFAKLIKGGGKRISPINNEQIQKKPRNDIV